MIPDYTKVYRCHKLGLRWPQKKLKNYKDFDFIIKILYELC